MKRLIIILLMLMLVNTVYGATVHGSIYDFSLERLENVVIEINTRPAQRQIAIDGSYSFEVPSGSYTITAKTIDNEILTTEDITIVADGIYTLDLIAFIDIESLNENSELDIDPTLETEEKSLAPVIIGIMVILAVVILLVFYYKRKNRAEEQKEEPILDNNDLKKKVLDIIIKEDGRTTQKEIRKMLPYSEAKISLVLTELESEEKIKKIKKGRSNVIILNKN